MKWTTKHIEQLKASGKIKGFRETKTPAKKTVKPNYRTSGLVWLETNLIAWAKDNQLEIKCTATGGEQRVTNGRKWQFDFAFPSIKVAVEYEGGIYMNVSGHNTAKHYTKDTEKYNRATVEGWRVIRVTAKNYRSALDRLNELLNQNDRHEY